MKTPRARSSTVQTTTKVAKTQRSVQSIEVGGRLLLALSAHPSPIGLKDLAALSGLSAARAHPYLVSFARLGLIRQEPDTQRYTLGAGALRIGLASLAHHTDVTIALEVARDLATSSRHSVFLSLWADFGPTVVRIIDGRQPLHVNLRVGTVMSIFGSATGRAFAGSHPRARIDAANFPRDGGGTAHERNAIIRQSADELRVHGVVRAVGRPIPGVNAFSAPAFDRQGVAVVVITAMGREEEFKSAWSAPMARLVQTAAQSISEKLRVASDSGNATR